MLLRARIVLPMSRPPIADGAVQVSGGRIRAVGCWRDLSTASRRGSADLGEVVLLPGLINAHCHLDYTNMAGLLPPQKSFIDWIKLITAAKEKWNRDDFRKSWLRGAAMLLRSGTTTVGDIEAVPDLLPEVWQGTPLQVVSFLEMTGIRSRRSPLEVLREATDKIAGLPRGRCRAGLSPHAPYSTLPELLQRCASLARRRRWRITIHVAESELEFEMIRHARGEMFRWLQRNERNMDDCGLGSPVQHLHRAGLLRPNLLAVHANHLAPGDANLLAQHGVSVAHCPRSHDYFGHRRFPLRLLLRAGVNVCLGTDSLATVRQRPRQEVRLSLFAEMQELARREDWLRPKRIVEMVTRSAAHGLGLGGRAGEIAKDTFADLVALPFTGKAAQAWEGVVQHQGPVAASMIAGVWAIAPPNG